MEQQSPQQADFPQGEYSSVGIPDGPEGVRVTLDVMRALVKRYKTAPEIRELAMSLAGPFQQRDDWTGSANALFEFVRDRINYVLDIEGVETVQSPLDTLRIGAGDCDDKSVLLAALLNSVGHPARFAAVGFEPDLFEHVMVETKIGPRWVALESTKPVEMGWKPEGIVTKMLHKI